MSMRLSILETGHGLGTKALFALIGAASRQPVLDIIKLVKYRPDFYGKPMSAVTHEAMRGPSEWAVGDRELMAAVVAQANTCAFCVQAHSAVARLAYADDAKVAAVLLDLESAPIHEPLRVTLRLLRKLCLEHSVSAEDMRCAIAAGVSAQQIEDALAVAFAFETTTRLAEAFDFSVPSSNAMNAGAKFLLARGYR
jgi:uncharacterized peroxidase-related enzyme